LIKNCNLPIKDAQATEEPSSLKREHPALQNMKFIKKNSIFVGHFCPPGSGFRSTDVDESGANPVITSFVLTAGGE
jgi:hypothetical protein